MSYALIPVLDGKATYRFTTKENLEFLIVFENITTEYSKQDIGNAVIYLYSFYCINGKSVKLDSRISQTIINSIRRFMQNNNNVIIYIAETFDGKQKKRAAAFNRWFSQSEKEEHICKIDGTVASIEKSGEKEYVSIILSKNNPDYQKVENTFTALISGINFTVTSGGK